MDDEDRQAVRESIRTACSDEITHVFAHIVTTECQNDTAFMHIAVTGRLELRQVD